LGLLGLQLRKLHNNAGDSDNHHCTCHGHFGRCDTDRIVSIYVTTPKVAKASTIRVAVAGIITGVIALTFANGNTALLGKTQNKLECLYLVRIFRLIQYLTLRAGELTLEGNT
jgi:hypothetical protein